jgi:hypothetical protein
VRARSSLSGQEGGSTSRTRSAPLRSGHHGQHRRDPNYLELGRLHLRDFTAAAVVSTAFDPWLFDIDPVARPARCSAPC